MPFTFAHPGFALPIKKWKPALFSTTGLFFGSIAPDMDIIMRLSNQRFHIFQYDLFCVFFYIFPIALLFSIYFHLIIRNTLIDHLPQFLYKKLSAYKSFDFLNHLKKNYISVILSIFIAIYLHLFLDFISHWNAEPFEVYGGFMYQSAAAAMIYYYMAIYLPPVILTFGGFYLAGKYNDLHWADLRNVIPSILQEKEKSAFYLLFGIIALIIAIVKFLMGVFERDFPVDNLIIYLTNGFMVSTVVTPTLFYIRNKIKKVS